MSDRIAVDTSVLARVAVQLRQQQALLESARQAAEAADKGLSWQFKSAPAFHRRHDELKTRLREHETALGQHTATLGHIATRLGAAEKTVLARASGLSSPGQTASSVGEYCPVDPAPRSRENDTVEAVSLDEALSRALDWGLDNYVIGEPHLSDAYGHLLHAAIGEIPFVGDVLTVDAIITELGEGDWPSAIWEARGFIPGAGLIEDGFEAAWDLGAYLGDTFPPPQQLLEFVDGAGRTVQGFGQGFVEGVDLVGDAVGQCADSVANGFSEAGRWVGGWFN